MGKNEIVLFESRDGAVTLPVAFTVPLITTSQLITRVPSLKAIYFPGSCPKRMDQGNPGTGFVVSLVNMPFTTPMEDPFESVRTSTMAPIGGVFQIPPGMRTGISSVEASPRSS